jgi:hypothetical protein
VPDVNSTKLGKPSILNPVGLFTIVEKITFDLANAAAL